VVTTEDASIRIFEGGRLAAWWPLCQRLRHWGT
jgi:hypothetical protein